MNNKGNNNKGLKTLIICGIITVAIIIICVCFPEQFFGLFSKQASFYNCKSKKQKKLKKVLTNVKICNTI